MSQSPEAPFPSEAPTDCERRRLSARRRRRLKRAGASAPLILVLTAWGLYSLVPPVHEGVSRAWSTLQGARSPAPQPLSLASRSRGATQGRSLANASIGPSLGGAGSTAGASGSATNPGATGSPASGGDGGGSSTGPLGPTLNAVQTVGDSLPGGSQLDPVFSAATDLQSSVSGGSQALDPVLNAVQNLGNLNLSTGNSNGALLNGASSQATNATLQNLAPALDSGALSAGSLSNNVGGVTGTVSNTLPALDPATGAVGSLSNDVSQAPNNLQSTLKTLPLP